MQTMLGRKGSTPAKDTPSGAAEERRRHEGLRLAGPRKAAGRVPGWVEDLLLVVALVVTLLWLGS